MSPDISQPENRIICPARDKKQNGWSSTKSISCRPAAICIQVSQSNVTSSVRCPGLPASSIRMNASTGVARLLRYTHPSSCPCYGWNLPDSHPAHPVNEARTRIWSGLFFHTLNLELLAGSPGNNNIWRVFIPYNLIRSDCWYSVHWHGIHPEVAIWFSSPEGWRWLHGTRPDIHPSCFSIMSTVVFPFRSPHHLEQSILSSVSICFPEIFHSTSPYNRWHTS